MSWAKEAGFLLSLVPGNPMIRAGQLNSMLISNALHGHLPLAQLRKSRSMTLHTIPTQTSTGGGLPKACKVWWAVFSQLCAGVFQVLLYTRL